MTIQAASPRFAGLQLSRVHTKTQYVTDEFVESDYTLRFVPYSPESQVDVFLGGDNKVASFTNDEVGKLSSEKINKGIIPSKQEAYFAISSAIESPSMPSNLKDRFRKALNNNSFYVHLTHRVWDNANGWFKGTGYYGPDGELKNTFQSPGSPQKWDPALFNKFHAKGKAPDDGMYVAFDAHSAFAAGGDNGLPFKAK